MRKGITGHTVAKTELLILFPSNRRLSLLPKKHTVYRNFHLASQKQQILKNLEQGKVFLFVVKLELEKKL